MHLRKQREEWEEQFLSPLASLSKKSRGRREPETECNVRTAFQRDRDRIIHSKAFRRLKHKTQVFIAPSGDHYRTRLTHTLEVAQIARTVSRVLLLNEDLTEAIALGHDLGHTPFGHAGEMALAELYPGGFKHNEQSLRVVDYLEGEKGLNLTFEVRDGILNHTGEKEPQTLEGSLVRICDRIAYINHDIDDALRAGILRPEQLPAPEMELLGKSGSQRLNTMIRDLMENSWGKPYVTLSATLQEVTKSLRDFLFRHVYTGSPAKQEEEKAKNVVKMLYNYWVENYELLPSKSNVPGEGAERSVCDYIAGMTDHYIISLYGDLFLPKPWKE
ncbi:MAG TPA: deoxyguanosinetriphosphate triphosphohydrolase [Firmicutes bacterium]|nr:deoxyguanosinetriphosphate triphosphohydrolase [Bacillota bacterium]